MFRSIHDLTSSDVAIANVTVLRHVISLDFERVHSSPRVSVERRMKILSILYYVILEIVFHITTYGPLLKIVSGIIMLEQIRKILH